MLQRWLFINNAGGDYQPNKVCKYQRCYNGSIALYHKLWSMNIQLAPCYLFIWHSTAVGPIRCSTVADLAEVTPEMAHHATPGPGTS
jgi:hypothetical protein